MKKRMSLLFVVLCAFSVMLTNSTGVCYSAKAMELQSSQEIEPRGWITKLSLSINGGDGQVWGTVKNTFTLFPATVRVYAEILFL